MLIPSLMFALVPHKLRNDAEPFTVLIVHWQMSLMPHQTPWTQRWVKHPLVVIQTCFNACSVIRAGVFYDRIKNWLRRSGSSVARLKLLQESLPWRWEETDSLLFRIDRARNEQRYLQPALLTRLRRSPNQIIVQYIIGFQWQWVIDIAVSLQGIPHRTNHPCIYGVGVKFAGELTNGASPTFICHDSVLLEDLDFSCFAAAIRYPIKVLTRRWMYCPYAQRK